MTYMVELGYHGQCFSLLSKNDRTRDDIFRSIILNNRTSVSLKKIEDSIMSIILDIKDETFKDEFDNISYLDVQTIVVEILTNYLIINSGNDATIHIDESDNYIVRISCSGGGYERLLKEMCARQFIRQVYEDCFKEGIDLNILVT